MLEVKSNGIKNTHIEKTYKIRFGIPFYELAIADEQHRDDYVNGLVEVTSLKFRQHMLEDIQKYKDSNSGFILPEELRKSSNERV